MLNIEYERWIKRAQGQYPVKVVETDNFDVFEDADKLEELLRDIRQYCP